jgi:hypothetical protein
MYNTKETSSQVLSENPKNDGFKTALDTTGITPHFTLNDGLPAAPGSEVRPFSIYDCKGGKTVTLYCSSCGQARVVQVGCGCRACPSCRYASYRRLMAKYKGLVKEVPHKKMCLITLTRRIKPNTAVPLSFRVKHTKQCWQKLLRNKKMKSVLGGMYSIEVKESDDKTTFNVHIHALVEVAARKIWPLYKNGRIYQKADIMGPGGLITWQWLGQRWKKLTKDSYIVDITPVLPRFGGQEGGLKYILKYLLKAPQMAAAKIPAYNEGLHRIKLIHMFGSWYPLSKKYRFSKKPEKPLPAVCKVCHKSIWITEFELDFMAFLARLAGEDSKAFLRLKGKAIEKGYVFGVDSIEKKDVKINFC